MDSRVFQETKLTDGIYTRGLARYRVVATPAPILHCGSITLFCWYSPAFAFKEISQFGDNIIACQLATGERRWYIAGYYLAPGDGATIQDVEADMADQQRETELIVVGDLNVYLERTDIRGWD